MLQARKSTRLPITQNAFYRYFFPIWRDSANPQHIGLAVSGGVDSMALASLCSRTDSKTLIAGIHRPKLTAFIVDHGMREGSDEEAENVALAVQKLGGIKTSILTLDWSSLGDPKSLPNIEKVARILRYQALGRACRDSEIYSLLLGHHQDDLAETVMMRLANSHHGRGLRGMKSQAPIPECHGIYGVSESGQKQATLLGKERQFLQIEQGGVQVHRPLLSFGKDELIATCQDRNVAWFEDATNADPQLTLRNTIRSLWRGGLMPKALGHKRMLRTARTVAYNEKANEKKAATIFKRSRISLDVRSSMLTVSFRERASTHKSEYLFDDQVPIKVRRAVAASLMRRIMALVSPARSITLPQMELAVSHAFPILVEDGHATSNSSKSLTVAGVKLTRLPRGLASHMQPHKTIKSSNRGPFDVVHSFLLERPQMQKSSTGSSQLTFLSTPDVSDPAQNALWTRWQLFDGRFWIRVRYAASNDSPGRSILVRALDRSDLVRLNREPNIWSTSDEHARKSSLSTRSTLQAILKECAPGSVRFTLPVIVERHITQTADGKEEHRDEICALPSIGWTKKGWHCANHDDAEKTKDGQPWAFQCRYKMIEFGSGSLHKIRAVGPTVKEALYGKSQKKSPKVREQVTMNVEPRDQGERDT